MKIVQFYKAADPNKTPCVGVMRDDNTILDFKTVDEQSPNTLIGILQTKPSLVNTDPKPWFEKFEKDVISISDVHLLPPISGSDKVVCVGMNYEDHCAEQNCPIPKEPIFFNKFPSCLHDPFSDVPHPTVTTELDWEVELAVIIGKKGKDIPKDEAMSHVLGFTVANDLSAREWQLKKNGGQWLIGKAMDKFAPIGPAIVTTSEVGNPHVLAIKCRVNGEVKQNSNTSNLIFKIPELVSTLSQFATLLPGDVILTGTPPGVGVFAKPPCYLKRGDIVECEIEGLGTIRNKIV